MAVDAEATMNILPLLQSSCAVYALSYAVDSMGGVVETQSSTATYSALACRARQLSGAELVRMGRQSNEQMYRFYFGSSVTMRPSYVIRFGAKSYTVENVNNPDFQSAFLQVDCKVFDRDSQSTQLTGVVREENLRAINADSDQTVTVRVLKRG